LGLDGMSAEAISGGELAIGGLRCTLSVQQLSGTRNVECARHHFSYVRDVQHADHFAIHGSFDGERFVARKPSRHDSFFLPMGRRWTGRNSGSATVRVLTCDLEHSALARALGERGANVALEPQFGPSPIAPGLLERIEALCLAPDAFSRSYADALAVVFTFELVQAFASKPFLPPRTATIGNSRFKPVLDHIEESLESDTTLSDLAALTGLSISHFSHAFNATYGIAPHRYILRRRIDRAKTLLGVSDSTITEISSRVGFSSQSRFTQIFSRHTGLTPSAYRLALQK
jgi:AraC family transcriptional regulator